MAAYTIQLCIQKLVMGSGFKQFKNLRNTINDGSLYKNK